MSAAIHLHDPQTLHRHWESEQWNPWEIDLAPDREQWQGALADRDKALVYWALSSLMVAEERITTKFAGLVMAAEGEEEASFLASQQVDEARHMQFYARFQDEVLAEPGTIAAHSRARVHNSAPHSPSSSTRRSSRPMSGSRRIRPTRARRSTSSPPTTS